MENFLLEHEATLYTLTYFGSIIIVAVWEDIAPRRKMTAPVRIRWLNNFAFIAIDNLFIRWLLPLSSIVLAFQVVDQGWGLFQRIPIKYELAVLLSIVALDFSRYFQHVMLHKVPLLWRLHHMHHTDHDYDFSTGFRFHPIESIFTALMNFAVIIAFGAPVAAVILYETLFVLLAMVAHGNIRYPQRIDRILRIFVVTPEMHRVHHSAQLSESNSNFGGMFPWWDRIFKTYISQPAAGHKGMTIGLPGFNDPKHLTLLWMLADPFLSFKRVNDGRKTSEMKERSIDSQAPV